MRGVITQLFLYKHKYMSPKVNLDVECISRSIWQNHWQYKPYFDRDVFETALESSKEKFDELRDTQLENE